MKEKELESIKKYFQSIMEEIFTEPSTEDMKEYQRGYYFGLATASVTLSFLQGIVKYEDQSIEGAMNEMIENDLDDFYQRLKEVKNDN